MNPHQWAAVDDYITDMLVPADPVLEAVLQESTAAGLPPQAQVSPAQGKLLYLLAKTLGARTVLEIGTLGGYSTIWLARALPEGGRLITLEAEPKHAEVARTNIKAAGLANVVELRLGLAIESLARLAAERCAPFDMAFIDADKASTPEYFKWVLEHSRLGTLIIADNTVRGGGLIESDSDDPSIKGVRRFHELLKAEPRVSATTLQSVGSKGYDGFTLAVVVTPT